MKLLTWPISKRTDSDIDQGLLPRCALTYRPAASTGLPVEIALMLPTYDGAHATLQAMEIRAPAEPNSMVGLFMADPFLNKAKLVEQLHRSEISWVCNLPSVAQHDEEFIRYLDDVDLGIAREIAVLSDLQAAGFKVMPVITRPDDVDQCLALSPPAILILPRTKDYATGFPSANQRANAVRDITGRAMKQGWNRPVGGLISAAEHEHEVLWPAGIDFAAVQPHR